MPQMERGAFSGGLQRPHGLSIICARALNLSESARPRAGQRRRICRTQQSEPRVAATGFPNRESRQQSCCDDLSASQHLSRRSSDGGIAGKGPERLHRRHNAAERNLCIREAVVLVHGDSHFFRTDKPLPARVAGAPIRPSIENFTRVETFGSPNHHWVEVSVDPNDPNVFTVRQRIVAANVVKRE